MSHKDKKIEKIARLAADGKNTIVYAVNLDFLSNEEIEGYEEKRILIFIGHRDQTTCSKCIKGSCTVPVKRAEYPDGRKMAVYMCPDPDHGGRFKIELDQLRYWKINIEVLKEMGYCKKPEIPADTSAMNGEQKGIKITEGDNKPDDIPPVDYKVKIQGNQYVLTYKGNDEILPDTLGSKYIVFLLTHKDEDFSALQLETKCKNRPIGKTDDTEGLREVDRESDLGNLADYDPKQIQAAIAHLEQQIEQTDKQAEKDKYQEQIDSVSDIVARTKNIHGRKRKTGDPLANARSRVTQAINAIRNEKIKDMKLKSHLKRIHTGKYLSYKPDDSVFWEFY